MATKQEDGPEQYGLYLAQQKVSPKEAERRITIEYGLVNAQYMKPPSKSERAMSAYVQERED